MKNLTNNKIAVTGLTLAFGAVLICGLPAQARFDYDNWQPVKGQIHRQENRLEKALNRDYNQGMIDTLELAQMRRDLDGIKVQEDEYRMDHAGLGANDVKNIKAKLNQFQQDLNREEADKYVAQQPQQAQQEQQAQQPQQKQQAKQAWQEQQAQQPQQKQQAKQARQEQQAQQQQKQPKQAAKCEHQQCKVHRNNNM